MARFRYRLQKVYELRERKKKAQEEAVARAKAKVAEMERRKREVQEVIQQIRNEIRSLGQKRSEAPHTLYEVYTNYIFTQYNELDVQKQRLEQAQLDIDQANEELAWEQQLLLKAHAELEALVKHKEKAYEQWFEEEKQKEMKMLDEVAGQRYFRQQQEKIEEDLLDEALRLEALKLEELESADK